MGPHRGGAKNLFKMSKEFLLFLSYEQNNKEKRAD